MRPGYCGIDFGTSNSTVAAPLPGGMGLCALEGGETTLPSAIFFDYEDHGTHYGRDAMALYTDGVEGRRAFNEKRPPNFTGAIRQQGEEFPEWTDEEWKRLEEIYEEGEY